MPRDREEVRRRLQQAALEMYQERGYEETTAAEIAERAGVTERTFFRHFSDKREVLFGDDTLLGEALKSAIQATPPEIGPWETLFRAFQSATYLFVENRPFTEPRRRIIAGSPTLQERAQAKVRSVIAILASALSDRGVPAPVANLAAQIGMAALNLAVSAWFEDSPNSDLGDHITRAFEEVRKLSSS